MGIVTSGFGILQPRVSVAITGAFKSKYAHMNSMDASLTPYSRYTSDIYQDTFGEGNFYGKGLIHVDSFARIGNNVFPENRVLSHDLLESCYLRAALVSDVELLEEHPSDYLSELARRHRWVRGDCQIGSWLLNTVPSEDGKRVKNPLTFLSKWKLFDNLRRALVNPSKVAMLIYCYSCCPLGSGAVLATTLSILLTDSVAFLGGHLESFILSDNSGKWSDYFSALAISVGRHATSSIVDLALTVSDAYNNLHAMATAFSRLYITKRLLLEWRASDLDAQRFTSQSLAKALRCMWSAPTLAMIFLCFILSSQSTEFARQQWNLNPITYTTNCIIAFAVFLSWLLSPALVWWLRRPYTEADLEPEHIDRLS